MQASDVSSRNFGTKKNKFQKNKIRCKHRGIKLGFNFTGDTII